MSVLPGEPVRLMVSGTGSVRVVALRLGWAGGAGATREWAGGPYPVRRQGPGRTVGATRTVVAGWRPTVTLDTVGWAQGLYLLRLDGSAGVSTYVPLVVRSASARGRVLLVSSVTTWQAYNDWGGRNLYTGPRGPADRSTAVSFDRPYASRDAGLTRIPRFDRGIVTQAERAGVPLAYASNLDFESDASALDGARGIVLDGHDEYWTAAYRDAVTHARDQGTNLAFLGANAVYWRARTAASPLGPHRLLVVYKQATLDPRRHSRTTTTRWRDEPHREPEELLVGQRYRCNPAQGPWRVRDPDFFLFRGTGVRAGTTFANLAGTETDDVVLGPTTPHPLQVVAASTISCGDGPGRTTSTYYTAPSGAGVFSAGTMAWAAALAGRSLAGPLDPAAITFVRRVTGTLLREMQAGPMGDRHPARDDAASVPPLPPQRRPGAPR